MLVGGQRRRHWRREPSKPSRPAHTPTPAQQRLRSATALIVGAGGLGCPAALYLAAAGVGAVVVADGDVVDASNLHRQIAHTPATLGVAKAASLAAAITAASPGVAVTAVGEVTSSNAVELAQRSTVVLDCTDNAAARYLLSDASAAAGVPLVCGAALGTDGQVTVFGPASSGAPCRRCVFPVPPPPAACGSCAAGGVLGPVPGVIGVLQALEAIKVVTQWGEPLGGRLLLFDGAAATVRVVTLREPSPTCPACGPTPSIVVADTDYEAFVGAPAHDGPPAPLSLLPESARADAPRVAEWLASSTPPRLLDVRPPAQYALGRLKGAVNVPWGADFVSRAAAVLGAAPAKGDADASTPPSLVVVCHRGNDSQRAVDALTAGGGGWVPGETVVDLIGGVEGWGAHCAASGRDFVRY